MEEAKSENLKLNSLGVTDDEAQQIGLRLKEKRKQNPEDSIEKISSRLKINKFYIEIIESGEWDTLPQSANGRGFVRLYANELEVSLPEFEKFRDVQKVVTLETQTNLDKIVACAREKRLVHMNTYQTIMSQAGPMIKNFFSSRKKWIVLGSFGVVVVGTMTSFILSKDNSSNDVNTAQIVLSEEPQITATESIQTAPTEAIQTAPTETAQTASAEAVQTAPELSVAPPVASVPTQKMQLEVLSPVSMHIKSDEKQIVDGLTQPGTLNFEFKKKILLIIEDSSKVQLSYAGWEHEQLSPVTRKRTIVLNAKPFEV